MIYAFGEFEIDEERFEIRRNGLRLEAQAKVLETLVCLVSRRDRVVTKDELIKEAWGGLCVADASLSHAVMVARRILDDDAADQRFIRTVRGKGYRFIAEVTERAPTDPSPENRPLSVPPEMSHRDLVGREPELRRLSESLDRACSGQGEVVLVSGEPGVGKSKLVESLAVVARERGTLCLWGRCWGGGGAPALWPWTQVLRSYAEQRGADVLIGDLGTGIEDVLHLLPEIRSSSAAPPSPPSRSPQTLFRVFDSIITFLKRTAKREPLLIVVDDLHAADEASTLLSSFLAREIRSAAVLLVGCYRHTDQECPLSHSLGSGLLESQRLDLRGLSERDSVRFIAAQLEACVAIGEPFAKAVYAATQGNPLLLLEIARLVAAEYHGNNPGAELLREFRIPERLAEAIRRRLGRFSDVTRRLLATASVIEREFNLALLSEVCEIAPQDALAALESALSSGILRETDTRLNQYAFCHKLLRDTLYGDLPVSQRTKLHLRVGAALERAGPACPTADLEIAFHYVRAAPLGDANKAVAYSVTAAERSMALMVHDQAIHHYQRALDVLELAQSAPAETRRRLLLGLREAQVRAGREEEARATSKRITSITAATSHHD